jgi:hypothetical protein
MHKRFLFAALLAANAPVFVYAQQHMLEYVLPRGGTRGATMEVALHGRFLNDPREVLFYGPGIRAVGMRPGAKPAEEVLARFEIAPDCPLGEHVLRLRTATALSEAVTFWVSPFPTIHEIEKKIGENDTPATAQSIPLNSTVEGQIQPGDHLDVDDYRIEVQQGQRISVEVEAVRLGTHHLGGENDMMARVLDERGKAIAENDDSAMFVQDPLVSVVAPRTGSYIVEIGEQMFPPHSLDFYRAHIGSFSRPTGIYPAGGPAGETITARILGDPAGEREERIALPRQPGDFAYFSGVPGERPPSPNMLRVSPYPNVLKQEGDEPTPVPALPAALNGILVKRGETDVFRFSARKGETWKVRLFARTLGSPIDPKIWIRAADGAKNLVEADDARLTDLGLVSGRGNWAIKDTLDPVVLFKPPADGAYLIGIEDTRGAAGADHVYRVEIEPVRDLMYTHISSPDGFQVLRNTGLIVPQGNRWTLDVQVAPGLGTAYKGDLELEAKGLPRGVTMIAPRFTKGLNRLPVQFVAAPGAEQQAALIELLARPVDRSVHLESHSQQGLPFENQGGNAPWHYVFVDKFALAVTQAAPFHVELEQPSIPLIQNGELALKVRLVRESDFKDPVEIQMEWLPPGVSRGSPVAIPAGQTEATYKLQANNKAAGGVYKIAMNATTTGGDGGSGVGRIRVSSPFVDLTLSEPYLAIDLKRAAVERGQRGEIVAAIQQNKPFAGKAKVVLTHLPKGVKMVEPAPEITSKDTQAIFRIEAEADALLGLYKEISCEVTFMANGQAIRQTTGSGVLRVDPARGPAQTTAEAR